MPSELFAFWVISGISLGVISMCCILLFATLRRRLRERLARERAEREKVRMAQRLQRTWRGYTVRKKTSVMRAELAKSREYVARKLQAQARRHKAKDYTGRLKEYYMRDKKEADAARVVQAEMRRFLAERRREEAFVYFAICRMQAYTRRFLVQKRMRFVLEHKAAELLQAT